MVIHIRPGVQQPAMFAKLALACAMFTLVAAKEVSTTTSKAVAFSHTMTIRKSAAGMFEQDKASLEMVRPGPATHSPKPSGGVRNMSDA